MTYVGKIFKIRKGRKEIESFDNTLLRYIQIDDLRNNDNLKYCVKNHKNVLCDPTDILIAWDGANAGTIGYGLKGAIGSTIAKLSTERKDIFIPYGGKFLQSKSKYLRERCTGATIPHISRNELERINIPLPPLETQQKIAAFLDKADELVQNDKKILEKYDQLAQSVFLEMFGDPAYTKTKWQQMTLPEFIDKGRYSIKRGPFGGALKKEIFVNEGYLIYEQYHAINDDFSMARYFINQEKFNELSAFRVYPGDLIISCSGVTLGRIAELPEDAIPGIINQALLKITLDRSIMNITYFKFLFKNDRIQDVLFGVSRGSGIPNFPPMTTIKSITFPVPPIELQNRFAEIIKHIEIQKQVARHSLQKSEELFLSLLQGVFRAGGRNKGEGWDGLGLR